MGKALIIVDVQPTSAKAGNWVWKAAMPSPNASRSMSNRIARIRVHRHHTGLAYRTGNALVGQSRLRRHLAGARQGRHRERRTASRDRRTENHAPFKKGQYSPSYSGFEGSEDNTDRIPTRTEVDADLAAGKTLANALRAAGVTRVDVVGLAESHCVKETALDAKKLGYETHVIENLTEPVSEELGVEARRQMREAGVVLD